MAFFLVFCGGGLGSLMRYLISLFLQKYTFFPYATFLVNVLGAFLMGMAFYIFVQKGWYLHWKLFFMVGFLGGFTTFSSFGLELFIFLKTMDYQKAFFYLLTTNFFVIFFLWCGFILVKKLSNS
ncbi:fluoride efflux transporter CrcB [Helicobacter sp. faydin-H20]|uniref:fluoride efflux transporter CrcB n=1 Tax=Helicobacter anatolicus TaxID=2905874 RepID=UPI001E332973|nr:fluoride efflux transporter CrcB [Helicobacter anatolicus]MCE3036281.1 fluoride efflux transporter CrcB [Helicobacter anatolicus]